jgi:hypothetical protein
MTSSAGYFPEKKSSFAVSNSFQKLPDIYSSLRSRTSGSTLGLNSPFWTI